MSDAKRSELWFKQGCDAHRAGKYRKAFKLFAHSALCGGAAAMPWLSSAYNERVQDMSQQKYWDACSVKHHPADGSPNIGISNLAVDYRLSGDLQGCIYFLKEALKAGDDEAALDLAKLYSVSDKEKPQVKKWLLQVMKSKQDLTAAATEEAQARLDYLAQTGRVSGFELGCDVLPDVYAEEVNASAIDFVRSHFDAKEHDWRQTSREVQKRWAQALMLDAFGKYKKARKILKKLAKKDGCAPAMDMLGMIYRKGRRERQCYRKSIKWYERAIEAGYVPSMVGLATVYWNMSMFGLSECLLKKAVAGGSDEGALWLAKLYAVSDKESKRVHEVVNNMINSGTTRYDLIYDAKRLLSEFNDRAEIKRKGVVSHR